MTGGNGLADDEVNTQYYFGLPDFQNVLILPKKESEYYVINQSLSNPALVSSWPYPNKLYYSVVDMALLNGKGAIIEKRSLINSANFMDGHMTASQHANGRDWWLVQRGYNNNGYFIYLVTQDSIRLIREQFIGASSMEPDAVGQSSFSPDGSMYISITGKSPLIIMDFDRCDGSFYNARQVRIPIDTLAFNGQEKIIGGGGNGVCFSPNNRFVYVNSLYALRQYDLLQSPIDSSEEVLFLWTDTNEVLGQFNQMQLGPDGKIYIAPYQGYTYALHTIEHPDSAGLACSFRKWGLPLPTNDARAIPNMVHFRMGPLTSSGCDTLTRLNETARAEKEKTLKVFPNPATDYVTIDYGFTDWNKGEATLEITNQLGQVVHRQILPMYSGFQKVEVSQLATGVYTAFIKRGVQVVATAKFVRE